MAKKSKIKSPWEETPECECFWCWRPLLKTECTRDHLISKDLWRFIPESIRPKSRCPNVPCCRACNAERAKISHLYRMAKLLSSGWQGCREGRSRVINKRKKLLPRMMELRAKIETFEKEDLRAACLHEIDFVLQYGEPARAVLPHGMRW